MHLTHLCPPMPKKEQPLSESTLDSHVLIWSNIVSSIINESISTKGRDAARADFKKQVSWKILFIALCLWLICDSLLFSLRSINWLRTKIRKCQKMLAENTTLRKGE